MYLLAAHLEEVLRRAEGGDLDLLDRLRAVDGGRQLAVPVGHLPEVGDVEVVGQHPPVLEHVPVEGLERHLLPPGHVGVEVVGLVVEAEGAEDRVLPRSHLAEIDRRDGLQDLGLIGVPVAGRLELRRGVPVPADQVAERVGLQRSAPLRRGRTRTLSPCARVGKRGGRSVTGAQAATASSPARRSDHPREIITAPSNQEHDPQQQADGPVGGVRELGGDEGAQDEGDHAVDGHQAGVRAPALLVGGDELGEAAEDEPDGEDDGEAPRSRSPARRGTRCRRRSRARRPRSRASRRPRRAR